jgi:hypothetical protein
MFRNCPNLTAIIIRAETPPTLTVTNILEDSNVAKIYVPDGLVDTYKTAGEAWTSTYASKIEPLSSLSL